MLDIREGGGDWLSGQCVGPLSTSTLVRDVVSAVRYLSRLRLESNGKLPSFWPPPLLILAPESV